MRVMMSEVEMPSVRWVGANIPVEGLKISIPVELEQGHLVSNQPTIFLSKYILLTQFIAHWLL